MPFDRPVQRERHMTEMSAGERAAAADKEIAEERYQARKEEDLLWRSKALAHEAAEAERKQEATSKTGDSAILAEIPTTYVNSAYKGLTHANENLRATSEDAPTSPYVYPLTAEKASNTFATENGNSEQSKLTDTTKTADTIGSSHATEDGHNRRKLLNIDSDVANNQYRLRTEAIKAERPLDGGSNALAGTALENASAADYASPMDFGNPMKPQGPLSQEPLTREPLTHEPPILPPLTPQPLTYVPRTADLNNFYGPPDGDTSTVHEGMVAPNPPLTGEVQDYNYTSAGTTTMVAEGGVNNGSTNAPANPLLEGNYFEAWKLLALWLKDLHLRYDPDVSDRAWSQDVDVVFTYWSQWMTLGNTDIWNHVSRVRVLEFAEAASGSYHLFNELFGGVTSEMEDVYTNMKAVKKFLEKEEKARIDEEERNRTIFMAHIPQQQRPQTPPVQENDEDLYGNSPRGAAHLEATRAARKTAKEEAQSTAISEVVMAVGPATGQGSDAYSRAEIENKNAQLGPAVQQ